MNTVSQTNIALGSEATLKIVSDASAKQQQELFVELWTKIYAFEKQFSRFLPYSELSMFNRSAGIRQPISPAFKELLLTAQKLSAETKGLFNPFLLPAIQRAGYTRSFVEGAESDVHDDYSDKAVVAIEKLEIGTDWACIPYGTAIDLGGCGKGYLADQLAKALQGKVIGYSVSLGGDIVTFGTDKHGQNWNVLIQSANAIEGEAVGDITMPKTQYAIATSGTTKRKGIHNGKSWHHIIDPNTLQPSQTDLIMTTVGHESGVYADVLASCAIIVGSKKAPSLLKRFAVRDFVLQKGASHTNATTAYEGENIEIYKIR